MQQNPHPSVLRRARRVLTDVAFCWSERLSRVPNPAVRFRQAVSSALPGAQAIVEALRRDGVAVVPEYIRGERLREAQAQFDAMVGHIRQAPPAVERAAPPPRTHVRFRVHSVFEEEGVVECLNPFAYSPALLGVAVDDLLREVVERYWGKRCMLSQASACRYAPAAPCEYGSFGWHHDSLGKRVSVMLILTDVGEDDQHMTYLKGTHNIVHPLSKSYRNWTNQMDQFSAYEPIKCTGKAGTLFFFNPNGMHRGNRRETVVRDSVVTSYCYGYYNWPFDVPRAFAETLSEGQREFLHRNQRVQLVDEPAFSS
ncbi:MAG: phytanoyl-CoA dioxygenase family protein [Planctomycetota bacterium]